jgi:hypothetical protein
MTKLNYPTELSERMQRVAAKHGLDGGATKALFVKFCAYYRGNGAEHDDWEKTWAGWVAKQYVKVGSPGPKRWEKSEHDNIVKMRTILERRSSEHPCSYGPHKEPYYK